MEEQGGAAKEAWAKLAQKLRIPALVVFTGGCFGVLLFLWIAFGGSVPLKAAKYEIQVDFQSAATLAQQADVRISGVNVGKVRKVELDKGSAATKATLSIDPKFAPIRRDARAILRQKSLLGEAYVEIAPGPASAPAVKDGGMLRRANVERSTQLDEILSIFDKPTKRAFRAWVKDSALSIKNGGGRDLNDALGNLSGFATDGADILGVLDNQGQALRLLVKNTGTVFGALNERQGQLRGLIESSHRTFQATSQERSALAETFAIFPTFLEESKQTLGRLERFSRDTEPLVRSLQPVADDLAPTIQDVAALSPDLTALFRDLRPVIRASVRDLPQAQRFLRGAQPVFEGLRAFLPELNPILSYANFDQTVLAGLFAGSAAFNYTLAGGPNDGVPVYTLEQWGVINNTSLQLNPTRPAYDRGNAYPEPNAYARATALGIQESFDCKPTGAIHEPSNGVPPCYVKPPSLYHNTQFPTLGSGYAPLIPSPGAQSLAGTKPPRP